MEAKEIEAHGRDLLKAASSGASSPFILETLTKLRDGVNASAELLRSTKIGVTVNNLRKHKDPVVQKQAGDLVGKWRKDVGKASPAPAKAGSKDSPAAAKGSPASTPNGPGTPVKTNARDKSTVPPDQRSAKADKVDTAQTGNAIRDGCLKLMYDGLAFMSEEGALPLCPAHRTTTNPVHRQLQAQSSPSPQQSKQPPTPTSPQKPPHPTRRRCAPSS